MIRVPKYWEMIDKILINGHLTKFLAQSLGKGEMAPQMKSLVAHSMINQLNSGILFGHL